MKKHKISRDDIGRSFEEFFRCKFIPFSDRYPIPSDLLVNLKKEYLRRELWVPLEKKDGIINILVDDPNNILKRDMIENLLKTKAVRYDVSLPGDIIKYINHFYHSTEDESSITEILGRLDAEDEDTEEDEEIVNESDSVIMQLVNKIILDAQARRASDIHIEPNVAEKKRRGPLPGRRRLRTSIRPSPTTTVRPSSRASRSCRISTSRSGVSRRTARSSSRNRAAKRWNSA